MSCSTGGGTGTSGFLDVSANVPTINPTVLALSEQIAPVWVNPHRWNTGTGTAALTDIQLGADAKTGMFLDVPTGTICFSVTGNATFRVTAFGTKVFGDIEFTNGPVNTTVTDVRITYGTGDPNTVVNGEIGSLFLRTDGISGTTLYGKTTVSGTLTGWVPFSTGGNGLIVLDNGAYGVSGPASYSIDIPGGSTDIDDCWHCRFMGNINSSAADSLEISVGGGLVFASGFPVSTFIAELDIYRMSGSTNNMFVTGFLSYAGGVQTLNSQLVQTNDFSLNTQILVQSATSINVYSRSIYKIPHA